MLCLAKKKKKKKKKDYELISSHKTNKYAQGKVGSHVKLRFKHKAVLT
jgi:hypothetical protein